MDNKTLSQLATAFSVHDIMTSVSQLIRADNLKDAKTLFNEFDVVPSPRAGEIKDFFKRDSEATHSIQTSHVVSDSTSLFDLPPLLSKSHFYFVISGNQVTGYVHYSDLNKPIVKISFFAMFQIVERKLWDRIKNRVSEHDLVKVFDQGAAARLVKNKRDLEKGNVDLGWTGVFSFPYILKLARFYGHIDLTDEEIKLLKETRNKVAHSDQNLVSQRGDVLSLAEAHDLFKSIVGGP